MERVIGLAASGRGRVCWRSGIASSSISMAAAAFAAAVATGESAGLGGAGGGTYAGAGGGTYAGRTGSSRVGLGSLVRLLAGAAIAHERGQTIEGIHLAGGDFGDLRLGGSPAGQAADRPADRGLIRLSAEPGPATCATSHLCHPGDRRDHHEHDKDEKNEFD